MTSYSNNIISVNVSDCDSLNALQDTLHIGVGTGGARVAYAPPQYFRWGAGAVDTPYGSRVKLNRPRWVLMTTYCFDWSSSNTCWYAWLIWEDLSSFQSCKQVTDIWNWVVVKLGGSVDHEPEISTDMNHVVTLHHWNYWCSPVRHLHWLNVASLSRHCSFSWLNFYESMALSEPYRTWDVHQD